MLFPSWLRSSKSARKHPLASRTGRALRRYHHMGHKLALEWLEDRTLLSPITVITAADNGDDLSPVPGSLREAILIANATNRDNDGLVKDQITDLSGAEFALDVDFINP